MSLVLQQDIKRCYLCKGTKTTRNQYNSLNWYNKPYGKNKQICQTCYARIYVGPKYRANHKEQIKSRNLKQNRRTLRFLGTRQLKTTFRQLTGYCSQCSNNIYDGTCKRTNMHHRIYIIIFPWFGTVELCVPCHNRI